MVLELNDGVAVITVDGQQSQLTLMSPAREGNLGYVPAASVTIRTLEDLRKLKDAITKALAD